MPDARSVLFLFMVLLFAGHALLAQDTPKGKDIHLNRKHWKELREEMNYDDEVESYMDRRSDEDGTGGAKQSDREGHYFRMPSFGNISFNASPVLNTIVIALIVAVLAGLIIFIFIRVGKNNSIDEKEDPEDESLDIRAVHESDLDRWLKEALADKDYRRAVRIYFLFLIKGLNRRGLIKWEKQKTNTVYLRELRSHSSYKDIRALVSDYEWIWYGKRRIEAPSYHHISSRYELVFEVLGINRDEHQA